MTQGKLGLNAARFVHRGVGEAPHVDNLRITCLRVAARRAETAHAES